MAFLHVISFIRTLKRKNITNLLIQISIYTFVQLSEECRDNRRSNNRRCLLCSIYIRACVIPSVSSQTNEASKLGTDKHRGEEIVFEVPLIANGLAAETGAGKAILSATTNVALCITMVNTWMQRGESPQSSETRSSKRRAGYTKLMNFCDGAPDEANSLC